MRVKSVDAASRKVKVDWESKYPVKRNSHSAHMQQVHAEKKKHQTCYKRAGSDDGANESIGEDGYLSTEPRFGVSTIKNQK